MIAKTNRVGIAGDLAGSRPNRLGADEANKEKKTHCRLLKFSRELHSTEFLIERMSELALMKILADEKEAVLKSARAHATFHRRKGK